MDPSRAPFGLAWGMSKEAFNSVGWGDGLNPNSGNTGAVLRFFPHTSGVPHVPQDAEMIDLFFGYNNRLFRVYAQGENGSSDYVKERYEKFKSLLNEIYGPGSETVASQSWFRRPEYGSISRYTSFSTNDVEVDLSLHFGNPFYWVIDYENRAGATEFHAQHRKNEKDAL